SSGSTRNSPIPRRGSKGYGSDRGAATSESPPWIPTPRLGRGDLEQDPRRELGWAPAPHEIDRVVQVDLHVRREHRSRVEVVPSPAERVEPPGEDFGRLVHAEIFELCRRHSLPPLVRADRRLGLSIAMRVTSSMVPGRTSPTGRDVPSRSGGRRWSAGATEGLARGAPPA